MIMILPKLEMKKVMKSLYVHKSNLQELFDSIPYEDVLRIKEIIKSFDKNYEIVKYDYLNKNVSLIDSPDWNVANEPTVGDSYTFKQDGTIVYRKGGKQVYHNKWQFVSSNYTGFDIEKSKRRTKEWNSIPGISDNKLRIGNKEFWHNYLRRNGLKI